MHNHSKFPHLELSRDSVRQCVRLITTGGTIDKSYDEVEGSLGNRDSIIRDAIYHRLRMPYTHLVVDCLMAKDSLEMTDQDREQIAQTLIETMLLGDPIVVLHGTDTLAQTLQYCYDHTQGKFLVPVVFTGAMRPMVFEKSDADQNITEALMCAKLLPPGLYLSFHGQIFIGPKVRKNRENRTFEYLEN